MYKTKLFANNCDVQLIYIAHRLVIQLPLCALGFFVLQQEHGSRSATPIIPQPTTAPACMYYHGNVAFVDAWGHLLDFGEKLSTVGLI